MFLEGEQTRKHCFLAMFPEGGQTRKHCFLAMFPEGGQTRKHCFLAMLPEAEQTRKQCLLQPSSRKWRNKKPLFPPKKSLGETIGKYIGKYVCFVRTVSKAGETAKHSRKLEDSQMFPN
jgi:hypothetical protein